MKENQAKFQHIVTRGNSRQIIFEGNRDYKRFLESMINACKKEDVELHAYCLMDNHVHMLFKGDKPSISKVMQVCSISYVRYFNTKYDRVGHLFQGRYKAEGICDEAHYFSAVRYILRNPQKAGIARADRSLWNSYESYFHPKGSDVNVEMLRARFKDPKQYKDFILGSDADDETEDSLFIEYDNATEKDLRALAIIRSRFGIDAPETIKTLPKPERNALISQMKSAGISIRRIERLTGIGRGIIQHMK